MTETKRRNHGRNHSYLLDGEKVPGVTTLIKGGFPKPALLGWAARTVAEKAVDNWDALSAMPVSERLRTLKRAHLEARNKAAVRGTRVHALAHRLSKGEVVDVPDELAGHVRACVQFLNDWDVEPIITERPVFSRQYQYGGSPDMVAGMRDGLIRLVDYKTGGLYGDMAWQLAAYRYAEFYLDEDGKEQEMPPVDEACVVQLRADGYELVPLPSGPDIFAEFLYIAEVAGMAERCRDYLGEALQWEMNAR